MVLILDKICLKCMGSGKIQVIPTSFGAWKETCPKCYGTGIKESNVIDN
jgi:DnaJ-class molecular chaperone